jgi:hypothetical protein
MKLIDIKAVFFGLVTIFIARFLLFALSDMTIKKHFLIAGDNTTNAFIVDMSEYYFNRK